MTSPAALGQEELQKERQDHVQTKESLKECKEVRNRVHLDLNILTYFIFTLKNKSHKVISRHFVHGMVSEVAASLMADRDATRQELEDCRRF